MLTHRLGLILTNQKCFHVLCLLKFDVFEHLFIVQPVLQVLRHAVSLQSSMLHCHSQPTRAFLPDSPLLKMHSSPHGQVVAHNQSPVYTPHLKHKYLPLPSPSRLQSLLPNIHNDQVSMPHITSQTPCSHQLSPNPINPTPN